MSGSLTNDQRLPAVLPLVYHSRPRIFDLGLRVERQLIAKNNLAVIKPSTVPRGTVRVNPLFIEYHRYFGRSDHAAFDRSNHATEVLRWNLFERQGGVDSYR